MYKDAQVSNQPVPFSKTEKKSLYEKTLKIASATYFFLKNK